jgi:hypothetical protein
MTTVPAYYLSSDLSIRETTTLSAKRGSGVGCYHVAIRRVDRPGWIFRYKSLGVDAFETLSALNRGASA